MSCGSATVKRTYCSHVILATSTVTCARAGRIANAMSGNVNQTRLNLFITRLPLSNALDKSIVTTALVAQSPCLADSFQTNTPPSRAPGRGTLSFRGPAPPREVIVRRGASEPRARKGRFLIRKLAALPYCVEPASRPRFAGWLLLYYQALTRAIKSRTRAHALLGVLHGPACVLEGLPQALPRVLSHRALPGLVELGAGVVQPHQQEDRQPAQAAERRCRNRRSRRQGRHR